MMLRVRCISGTGVRQGVPLARNTTAINARLTSPRKKTSSKLLKLVDANLTHTAMPAKKNAASTIHKACMRAGGPLYSALPMAVRYQSWKCCMPSSMGLW